MSSGSEAGKLDTDGILILNQWDTSKFSLNIGGKDVSRPIAHFDHDCKGNKTTRKLTVGSHTGLWFVEREGSHLQVRLSDFLGLEY
jgi:hypothetical protein